MAPEGHAAWSVVRARHVPEISDERHLIRASVPTLSLSLCFLCTSLAQAARLLYATFEGAVKSAEEAAKAKTEERDSVAAAIRLGELGGISRLLCNAPLGIFRLRCDTPCCISQFVCKCSIWHLPPRP